MALFVVFASGRNGRGVAQAPSLPASGAIVVAQDGTGAFTTIQAALDSIPAGNTAWRTILIRNGTYAEKVFIKSSHVALVGEDRERTRIVFAELRKNWRTAHPDDWGAAVVNIADTATDLFIGNLTVLNNYGALHGDHDHQFAIRSGGIATRIWIVHARVAADGGDTLSLWNTGNGMYYHADCEFEGWVDYVCPRGWCYITNSRFVGHSATASIWHDGSKDPDQKLVVRRSAIDGDPGFALGRNNRDGQFFLLDNRFSASMADKPIYWPSAPESYQWPARVYYSGNGRDGAAFAWYRDNLREAAGAPSPRTITAAWTFAGKWDPEGTMPTVLPFASTPTPENGDRDVDARIGTVRWVGARDASSYRVSFGTVNPPPFRTEVRTPVYSPGPLQAGATYFWRVDAVAGSGTVAGPVWMFAVPAPPSATPADTPTVPARPPAPVLKNREGPPGGASPWRIRIVLVGDSTVTDDIGWGLGFKARVQDRADCVNLARNGRSSKSYRDEGSWARALEARPDYVLIQFGHNDMPGKGADRETDPRTTYRENLARFVADVRAAGAVPVIVTSITRRKFGDDGRIRSDLGAYVAAAKAVATDAKVALIDLHQLSIDALDRIGPTLAAAFNARNADGTADTTHLSAEGGRVFGGMVADELARVVPALAPYLAVGRTDAPPAPVTVLR